MPASIYTMRARALNTGFGPLAGAGDAMPGDRDLPEEYNLLYEDNWS